MRCSPMLMPDRTEPDQHTVGPSMSPYMRHPMSIDMASVEPSTLNF